MSNESKTVEEIVRGAHRDRLEILKRGGELKQVSTETLFSYLDDVLKAHRREVSELRECVKQAVCHECRHLNEDIECENCPERTRGKAFCSAERWRKALNEGEKSDCE